MTHLKPSVDWTELCLWRGKQDSRYWDVTSLKVQMVLILPQLFQNLLLSRDAQADSIPELEVSEHDVVGCDMGQQVDLLTKIRCSILLPEECSPNESKSTLIAAFLNSTLSEMGGDKMHGWLVSELDSDLSELGD